jgi:putative OPT family oligopeptide transporter
MGGAVFHAYSLDGGTAADAARAGWTHYVRFMGAGAIGVAAIWTLGKLVKPLAAGLAGSFHASRARKAGTLDQLPRTEHDIPIGMVGLISLLCFIPIGWLLWDFAIKNGLGAAVAILVIGGVAFVVLMSFLVSAVCGYMAGLIGSSNSPLSGIGILVVVVAALLLVLAVKPYLPPGRTGRWSGLRYSLPRSCSRWRRSRTTTSRI